MKKNLLAFLAITMAVAGSAFTVIPKDTTKAPFTTRYYWDYKTGAIGVYQGGFATHMAAKAGTGCGDIAAPDCSRGYLQSQLVDPTQPGSVTNPPKAVNVPFPDDVILKP